MIELEQFIIFLKNIDPKSISFIFSIISSIATIIASIVAIITLTIWRKQQLFGKKIDILMDLEDDYEILLTKHIQDYLWFIKLQNITSPNEGETLSNQDANDLIIKKYNSKLKDLDMIDSTRKYEVSYMRAKRLFPEINDIDGLSPIRINNIHMNQLKKITTNHLMKKTSNKALKDYLLMRLDIKNNALGKIKHLRDNLT